MNYAYLKIVVFASTLLTLEIAMAAEIEVTLGPQVQTVKLGARPRFVVTVSPVSTTQRIMKFAERSDLRHNYADLTVTQNGKRVEVSRIISDPGPTSDSDYIQLNPGQRLEFGHDGLPYILTELPPGKYSAVVVLRPDWRLEAATSNAVSFTVER
jgi:hypothetical protein